MTTKTSQATLTPKIESSQQNSPVLPHPPPSFFKPNWAKSRLLHPNRQSPNPPQSPITKNHPYDHSPNRELSDTLISRIHAVEPSNSKSTE